MPALAQAAAKPFLIALIGSSLRLVNSHSPVVASSSKILKTFCAVKFTRQHARLTILPLSNQNRLRWNQHITLFDFAVKSFIAEIDVRFPNSQYLFRWSDACVENDPSDRGQVFAVLVESSKQPILLVR
jgi:hypothetical protein